MFIADLHTHSKFSRATAKNCMPDALVASARRKGLNLIGTGDFTHAGWRDILGESLMPARDGVYRLAGSKGAPENEPYLMISGEISCIYKKNGRTRKVHHLILLPNLEKAESLSRRLESMGFNLHSDGRPILGLDSRNLLEITKEICPEAIFIPAHIWTPHFSVLGAYSGFDDITECYEDLTYLIDALETGLSADPSMIRRVSMLDRFALISNSDAHSPGNLAREATIFNTDISYSAIRNALAHPLSGGLHGTIEFFPAHGKYYYDGHRHCKVCQSPVETRQSGGVCPVCRKQVTKGVTHRVEELADRKEPYFPPNSPCYESFVPLPEVVAACVGFSCKSKRATKLYELLLQELGSELHILRAAPLNDIEFVGGPLLAQSIVMLREGKAKVSPGYDGEYGKIALIAEED